MTFLPSLAATKPMILRPILRAATLAAASALLGVLGCQRRPAAPPPIDTAFLEQLTRTQSFRLGEPTNLALTPDGRSVVFLRAPANTDRKELCELDVATRSERTIVTAARLLDGAEEQLTAEERARRERQRLTARGIASFELSPDGTRLLVPISTQLFVVERQSGAIREIPNTAGAATDAHFSPDAQRVGLVRRGDLYVFDLATNVETRLTTTATEHLTNGLAEFVAQEELDRDDGFWFSPDGSAILYEESDTANVETLFIADPASPEQRPEGVPYPRAGKTNARVRLGIVPVTGGETRWLSLDAAPHEYVARVVWPRRGALSIVVLDRTQRRATLLAANPETGQTHILVEEKDAAWINTDSAMPRWLEDGASFLWTTERTGRWVLEHRRADGSLIRPLTPGDESFAYRGTADVDEARARVIVKASGRDVSQAHLFEIAMDGGAPPRQLTTDDGLHDATFARDHRTYVDVFAGLRGPPRWTVRARDGRELAQLRTFAESPPFEPNVERVTLEPRGLRAAIVRPRSFRRGKKYPVIVSVYAGPHAQTVLATRSRHLLSQWQADRGYVVVTIDGRGTPMRGRAWERAIAGDFATVPLEDQVAGLQALGRRFPELDLSRVGISGWSFGGYFAALAVLRRPDVFHAAVAGAPVVDWRDYDTCYTERYLGVPDTCPSCFTRSSLLPDAAKLARPLLLVHGTADDNVYFRNSLTLADALTRAGKPFDFLPVVGATHRVRDPILNAQVNARAARFFDTHVAARSD